VLIPILYLKGISTGDFEETLGALLGKDAGGLSASTIGRLKEAWADEHARWLDRDLSGKRYVYFWVDGIYVQARLEEVAGVAPHQQRRTDEPRGRAGDGFAKRSVDFCEYWQRHINIGSGTLKRQNRNGPPTAIGGRALKSANAFARITIPRTEALVMTTVEGIAHQIAREARIAANCAMDGWAYSVVIPVELFRNEVQKRFFIRSHPTRSTILTELVRIDTDFLNVVTDTLALNHLLRLELSHSS
jgi:hypothetical protein